MKIVISELDEKKFKKYGFYESIVAPQGVIIGEKPSEFYRDLLSLKMGQCNVASISTCRVYKRPLCIDVLEYHSKCGEVMMPLDGDILLQVAPASVENEVETDTIEVFRVPKGTAVALNYGVWHHAPFAWGSDVVNILAILPERTYANDAFLYTLPKKVEINEF